MRADLYSLKADNDCERKAVCHVHSLLVLVQLKAWMEKT
jgi:hypothetical protein